MFRMGYDVQCIERSPVMAELIRMVLTACAKRLDAKSAIAASEIDGRKFYRAAGSLQDAPDCIYLDPMFPPKRKIGIGEKGHDRVAGHSWRRRGQADLFAAACRQLVSGGGEESDYADPMGGTSETYQGKLLRYDVYIK